MQATRTRDRLGRLVLGVALEPEQEDQIGHDSDRELAFAVHAADSNDAATLRWLGACALNRAVELEEPRTP